MICFPVYIRSKRVVCISYHQPDGETRCFRFAITTAKERNVTADFCFKIARLHSLDPTFWRSLDWIIITC